MNISDSDVDRLLLLARKRPANYSYLFDRLCTPEWLDALDSRGVFADPPPPVESHRGTLFPDWAPARYLVRIAGFASEHARVLAIVLRVPPTENVRVHLRLLEVLLKLPVELAVRAVGTVESWLSGHYRPLDALQYARFAEMLASGGEPQAATDLTRRLLHVSGATSDSLVTTGIGSWELGQALEMLVPALAVANPQESLAMFSDSLEAAVTVQEGSAHSLMTEAGFAEDNSWLWRPAIEDNDQNFDHEDILDALVVAVRDTASLAASADPSSVPASVIALEGRPFRVFHRIALHLLREFPDAAPELIGERLTDRTLFDDFRVRHEYYHLQQKCFGRLDSEQQMVILSWIEGGPPSDGRLDATGEEPRDRPTPKELDAHANHWRLKKLTPIVAYLPAAWADTYEKLAQEFGLSEHSDFVAYHTTWTGPTSPISFEELRRLSPSDLVAHVRAWEPTDEWGAPTPDGLGRLVTAVVAETPELFAAAAAEFVGVEATYMRSFLQGLREAADAKKPFPWEPVLKVAHRVVLDAWETAPRLNEYRNRDPDWGWTRKTIASLLGVGLQPYQGQIPILLRETVWGILRPLTDDPDPTPEDENTRGHGGLDAATLSINTVRGEAMHAVVRYGLWVKRHRDELTKNSEAAVPPLVLNELWGILDAHLEVERDPSLAIRSVYGQWFPWLQALDPSWAESSRPLVFPIDPELGAFWDAAWNSYIVFCPPFDDVFGLLRADYGRAVDRMGSATGTAPIGRKPHERLGEHLAAFVWRGKLTFDPVDPLLATFWSKAPSRLRRHVLEYVGRSIRDWPPDVSSEVRERLKAFWSFAVAAAGAAGGDRATSGGPSGADAREPAGQSDELRAFAWWFDSGKFDDEWAFTELERVSWSTSLIDPAFMIARRLAVLAQAHPQRSVAALASLVDSDKEGWRIIGWKEDARTILEQAIASGDRDAKRVALDVVNRLVARGRLEFRDLADAGGDLASESTGTDGEET